jgi:anti-anti-sigma factor
MDITQEKQDTVSIVGIKGRLDASSCAALEQELSTLVSGGTKQLVLNLENMDYVSSAGLRVLLVVAKKLGASNGKFALYGLKDHIKEVFDLAGFTDIFELFNTRAEALQGVQ